jgi:hypothetical protein
MLTVLIHLIQTDMKNRGRFFFKKKDGVGRETSSIIGESFAS